MPGPCPLDWLDLLRTAFAGLSSVLVVGGWYLVNAQNNNRESRKEFRQFVDRIIKLVGDVADAAIAYHSATAGTPDAAASWKLLIAIDQLRKQLSLLSGLCTNMEACIGPFLKLKQVITGRDFQTHGYVPWPLADDRWPLLLDATNSLKNELDSLFFESFALDFKKGSPKK